MERYLMYLRKSRMDTDFDEISVEETLNRHRRILESFCKERRLNVVDVLEEVVSGESLSSRPTLDDLHNPEDTAHSRIYDRLLSMCVPVRFTGDNFRQETAKRKMESMKKLITD